MHRPLATLTFIALFVLLLAVAGCGGGGDDSTTSTGATAFNKADATGGAAGGSVESGGKEAQAPEGAGGESNGVAPTTISKTKFVKEANAICTQATAGFESAARSRIQGLNQEKAETLVVELLVPAIETAAREIRELGAPAGEEEEVEAMASALQTVAEEGREEPFVLTVQRGTWDETEELAKKYGIESCSNI